MGNRSSVPAALSHGSQSHGGCCQLQLAILCFPSGSTAPTELTRSSEVTVQLHIPESSVKPRHQPATDNLRRRPACLLLPIEDQRSSCQAIP